MISKACPKCGYQFKLREFFGIASIRFDCPSCQVKLKSDFWLSALAIVLCAPIMAYPIMWAVRKPIMWLLVPVSVLVQLFVYYGVFSVSLAHKEAGTGRAK